MDIVKRNLWNWANSIAEANRIAGSDARRSEEELLRRAVTIIDEYERLLEHRPDDNGT